MDSIETSLKMRHRAARRRSSGSNSVSRIYHREKRIYFSRTVCLQSTKVRGCNYHWNIFHPTAIFIRVNWEASLATFVRRRRKERKGLVRELMTHVFLAHLTLSFAGTYWHYSLHQVIANLPGCPHRSSHRSIPLVNKSISILAWPFSSLAWSVVFWMWSSFSACALSEKVRAASTWSSCPLSTLVNCLQACFHV